MRFYLAIIIVLASCTSPTCPPPDVYNFSNEEWTGKDQFVFEVNMKREFCKLKYDKNYCMKKFIKRSKDNYHISCEDMYGRK